MLLHKLECPFLCFVSSFYKVFEGNGVVNIGAAFKRSLALGAVVMIITVVFSVAAGLAFRKGFKGAAILFYVAIASLIMPSIITSLGIALEFRLFDDLMINHGNAWGLGAFVEGWTTAMGLFTSGLGAHLTWTLPFGLLIMFAIFNRFDGRLSDHRQWFDRQPFLLLGATNHCHGGSAHHGR